MLKITPISAFNDNYIWVLKPSDSNEVYVVDPGDAAVVIEYLAANSLTLKGILITHHHHDHTGGISALQQYFNQSLTVYGPQNETIEGITVPLIGNQDVVISELNLSCCIIPVPGHTSGHIAYLIQGNLFCGDTLFSGGCGRLFEGTAEQMLSSLKRLSNFPSNTKIYCTHEYTEANLVFAVAADPHNPALRSHQSWVKKARENGLASLPSELAIELAINPFLRCHTGDVTKQVEAKFNQSGLGELEVFTLLRQWKDSF